MHFLGVVILKVWIRKDIRLYICHNNLLRVQIVDAYVSQLRPIIHNTLWSILLCLLCPAGIDGHCVTRSSQWAHLCSANFFMVEVTLLNMFSYMISSTPEPHHSRKTKLCYSCIWRSESINWFCIICLVSLMLCATSDCEFEILIGPILLESRRKKRKELNLNKKCHWKFTLSQSLF